MRPWLSRVGSAVTVSVVLPLSYLPQCARLPVAELRQEGWLAPWEASGQLFPLQGLKVGLSKPRTSSSIISLDPQNYRGKKAVVLPVLYMRPLTSENEVSEGRSLLEDSGSPCAVRRGALGEGTQGEAPALCAQRQDAYMPHDPLAVGTRQTGHQEERGVNLGLK